LERVSHELLAGGNSQLEDEIIRSHSYDEDDLKLAFVVGGATGVCMVIFIITFALCLKSCCEMRKKKSSPEVVDGDSGRSTQLGECPSTFCNFHFPTNSSFGSLAG